MGVHYGVDAYYDESPGGWNPKSNTKQWSENYAGETPRTNNAKDYETLYTGVASDRYMETLNGYYRSYFGPPASKLTPIPKGDPNDWTMDQMEKTGSLAFGNQTMEAIRARDWQDETPGYAGAAAYGKFRPLPTTETRGYYSVDDTYLYQHSQFAMQDGDKGHRDVDYQDRVGDAEYDRFEVARTYDITRLTVRDWNYLMLKETDAYNTICAHRWMRDEDQYNITPCDEAQQIAIAKESANTATGNVLDMIPGAGEVYRGVREAQAAAQNDYQREKVESQDGAIDIAFDAAFIAGGELIEPLAKGAVGLTRGALKTAVEAMRGVGRGTTDAERAFVVIADDARGIELTGITGEKPELPAPETPATEVPAREDPPRAEEEPKPVDGKDRPLGEDGPAAEPHDERMTALIAERDSEAWRRDATWKVMDELEREGLDKSYRVDNSALYQKVVDFAAAEGYMDEDAVRKFARETFEGKLDAPREPPPGSVRNPLKPTPGFVAGVGAGALVGVTTPTTPPMVLPIGDEPVSTSDPLPKVTFHEDHHHSAPRVTAAARPRASGGDDTESVVIGLVALVVVAGGAYYSYRWVRGRS